MNSNGKFSEAAKGLSRNPLGIIALFIVLIYGFASLTVGFSDKLALTERQPIIWFLVLFPFVVLIIFSWLVSCHHEKLYAPKDYSDDKYFLKGITSKPKKNVHAENLDQRIELSIQEALSSPDRLIHKESPDTKNKGFLSSYGIDIEAIKTEEDLIFVLTPFQKKYESQFEVIRKACIDLGLRCVRGDETFVTGDIFPHILNLICSSRLIVANIDGRNTNVFYELGVSHALEKDVILVASEFDNVPFDLKSGRIVMWKNHEELYDSVIKSIGRYTKKT